MTTAKLTPYHHSHKRFVLGKLYSSPPEGHVFFSQPDGRRRAYNAWQPSDVFMFFGKNLPEFKCSEHDFCDVYGFISCHGTKVYYRTSDRIEGHILAHGFDEATKTKTKTKAS